MNRSEARENNFDLIRLVAASQVMVVHAAEHFSLLSPNSPILLTLKWFPGVPIFFALSGFLISQSYERSTSLISYSTKRLLRIYPGLWVCLAVTVASVLIVAPSEFDDASPASFAGWIAAQASFLQIFNPEWLRTFGVGVLNGSLWTIPVELQFYALLPCLYLLANIQRPEGRKWLWLAIAISLIFNRLYAFHAAIDRHTVGMKIFGVSALPYIYLFLLGVAIQRHFAALRPWIKGRFTPWLALYLLISLAYSASGSAALSNYGNPLRSAILVMVAFSAAFSRTNLSAALLRGNDVSYGIYIYHMIVINVLLELGYRGVSTLVLTAIFTYMLAAASWRLVEKPSLRLKKAPVSASRAELSRSDNDAPHPKPS